MVSVDCMSMSILSVSLEALEMSCAVAAETEATRARNLKPDDLLHPLNLMCELKNPNLSYIQF